MTGPMHEVTVGLIGLIGAFGVLQLAVLWLRSAVHGDEDGRL